MMRKLDGKVIGRRLRELRGVHRTQEDVAQAVGVTKMAVSDYENGKRIPADPVKIKLASYFETTVGFLFYGESREVI